MRAYNPILWLGLAALSASAPALAHDEAHAAELSRVRALEEPLFLLAAAPAPLPVVCDLRGGIDW